jgi:hypothetical protein
MPSRMRLERVLGYGLTVDVVVGGGMAEGLRDRLIGAWRLAELSVIARDGSVTHPMGEDLEGLIMS